MPMTRRSVLAVTSGSIAETNKEGGCGMAEHRVRKDNIIYIIPDDELFAKWKRDEAFIDEYGRLMNRKPHRVLRELKHYVENTPMVQQRTSAPPADPVRKSSPVKDYIKDTVRGTAMEATEIIVDRAVDIFFYEVLPNVWHEHIVPFYRRTKEALTSKELKADAVLAKSKANTDVAVRQPKATTKMTQEEAYAEKRKVLYHWLGMLSSLKKLYDAGEMDIDATLAQLTNPAMLERVNSLLSENPNLLETDKYIVLHGLLGRDLYEERQLVPIRAAEITTIAAKYGYDARNDKMEDNHHG